ncbi:MAG TPA: ABC transporter ATP-binding protein [Burkholderiales bacterium]|nr:ABC transporter ATP-binding protein [Burkholderiales bacterium]
MMPALRTSGLGKHFGGVRAVTGVSLALARGARHAVIGPNGAGKTTLINLLTGMLAPSEGDVYLDEDRVTGLRPDQRVKRGLARTFQINNLFPDLTVMQSMLLAACEQRGVAIDPWRPVSSCRDEMTAAHAILRLLHLDGAEDAVVRQLPYGDQRLVEIALALACKPRVLLLDEPAAGVPKAESQALFRAIAGLPEGVTVLFVEHDMDIVFRFAQRITVLVSGAILTEGAPEDIARDPTVKQVYLGSR